MDDEAYAQAFAEWEIAEGDEIAREIYENLKTASRALQIENGSHASWNENNLGILIV
jgi:hypothetical protein